MQLIRETLCLLVAMGYLNEHLKEFEDMISPPKYLCTSCGRVAREAELFCLPSFINLCESNPAKEEPLL